MNPPSSAKSRRLVIQRRLAFPDESIVSTTEAVNEDYEKDLGESQVSEIVEWFGDPELYSPDMPAHQFGDLSPEIRTRLAASWFVGSKAGDIAKVTGDTYSAVNSTLARHSRKADKADPGDVIHRLSILINAVIEREER